MPNPLEMMINQAEIPGVSVARISGDDITTETAGVINADTHEAVSDTTVFEAASLSKPVFAYIVLKMAERGEIDLDRPLHEYCDFGPPDMRGSANYEKLTARMVLSHQAGLPNEFDPDHGVPFAYVSAAGKNFDYSGEAFRFLLEVVEKIKKPENLEDLARKEFAEIGMRHSSFSPPTGCSLIRLADDASRGHGKIATEHGD
jgi:CubicO group peptidase (beta-lactamase class C family)